MSARSIPSPTHPLVVQHNVLVNARFDLSELESRLFLALLSRIGRGDKQFAACRVPVVELMLEKDSSHSVYARVKQMLKEFSQRSVLLNKSSSSRAQRGNAEPDYKAIPLLAYAEYCGGEGEIEARFNDLLMPYLLDLSENFTKAELQQLMKLRSHSARRIYWLLREYAGFGKRTIALQELKEILGLATASAYERWDNFKARVLDKAQAELAATDLPFTYEPLKARSNGPVQAIRFSFAKRTALQLPGSAPLPLDPTTWQAQLLTIGVAAKSVSRIEEQLVAQCYDEGYIHFVVAAIQEKARIGQVKKVGGAIYKALTEGYLLSDYTRSKTTRVNATKQKPTRKAATATQSNKLQSELEDQRNSYRFVEEAPIYTAETRPAVLAKIQAHIEAIEARLRQLNA